MKRFGPILLAPIVAMALLSFVWTPWDVAAIDIAHRLQPVSFAHPLGTDQLGRDLLSMLMAGARPAFGVAALVGELARDYVRTARAKGVGRGLILRRHIAPNAAGPILAVIGLQFPFLLGGSVIVENVFYLPGLGRLMVQAITARDLIVVQTVAMLMVAATVIASFLTDVAQALLDPRLRVRP